MKRERRFVPVDDIEVRADGDAPVIEGYAARFNKWADIGGMFRERIAAGAFADTIADDDIRALFNHDPNFVLGRTSNGSLRLNEDNKGLFMENTPPGTQAANDVIALIDRRDVTGQSFGFSVQEEKWQTKEIDGTPTEHRTITKARLYDVGPVTYPAYSVTDVNTRSFEDVYEERMEQLIDEPSETVVDDEEREETPVMTSKANSLYLRNRHNTKGGDNS